MIGLRDLTLADALAVASRMRAVDRECMEAIGFTTDPQRVAHYHCNTEGAAWTVLDDGEPVAIGGVRTPVPWVGVVWFVCSDRMRPSTWKKLIRHGRIVLRNASQSLRRVECHVLSTWEEARVFALRMGFELEGVRHNAGRDGQDILTMVYRGKHASDGNQP